MLKLLKMENSALSLEKKSFVDIELLQADEPPLMAASMQRRQWQRQRWADDSPPKEHAIASNPIERVVTTHGG